MTAAFRRAVALVVAALAFVALPLAAQPAPAAAQGFPTFTGLVVDAANILPDATKADLTAKLEALQKDTHRQLVVATIPDLGGDTIDDYGYKLGRAWGVGLKGADNGAILFIAPNEPAGHRGPRIEVGYGLEPVLTDALSSVIINQDMMPRLRSGDVPGAMEAGTDAIIQQLRAAPDEAKAKTDAAAAQFDRTHRRGNTDDNGGWIGLVVWLVVMGIFVAARFGRRGGGSRFGGSGWPIFLWGSMLGGGGGGSGGGSSWSDGGGSSGGSDGSWGGGGFTGGGGGSFGGGGASGGW